jgi:hypothetical protein
VLANRHISLGSERHHIQYRSYLRKLSWPPDKNPSNCVPVTRRQKTAALGAAFGVLSTALQRARLAALIFFYALAPSLLNLESPFLVFSVCVSCFRLSSPGRRGVPISFSYTGPILMPCQACKRPPRLSPHKCAEAD